MDSQLHSHPLFKVRSELLDADGRVSLAYSRAREILKTWKLTAEDVHECSRRFWECLSDPILAVDGAAAHLIAVQVNLFSGTLALHLSRRPDLRHVIENALRGDMIGEFMVTEVDHGLDAQNLETTATKIKDAFILHTPRPGAAKLWSPSEPLKGLSRVAVVMARLLADGKDLGIHPFLVHISDKTSTMRPGISSARLPVNNGGSQLHFSVTSFNNVRLPMSALLSDPASITGSKGSSAALRQNSRRIAIGTSTLPFRAINMTCFAAVIAADYSKRRTVGQGGPSQRVPILIFQTQKIAILRAVAMAHVLKAWQDHVISYMTDDSIDAHAKDSMGVVLKVTTLRAGGFVMRTAGERLGGQGLCGFNMILTMEADNRVVTIAEGDVSVISIRLFSELLRQFYLPQPEHDDSLLARHAHSLFETALEVFTSLPLGHQDPAYNRSLLPKSETAITALGHAFAYSAALKANVARPLLDIFETWAVQQDEGWYIENAGLTQTQRAQAEERAVDAALPHLEEYLDDLDVRKYIKVPIQSDEAWEQWAGKLKTSHALPRNLEYVSLISAEDGDSAISSSIRPHL